MRARAARELLAPPEDVWAFLAQPERLADWWPGVAGIRPDRKGMAAGARWQVAGDDRPSLYRRPGTTTTLLVTSADPLQRFGFRLTDARLAVELTLEPRAGRRTLAALTVQGPFLIGPRRSLAQRALKRLYDLCQTSDFLAPGEKI